MSIFLETMTKAVGDYRVLLRRYLSQADRMIKLQKLGLRDSDLYASELSLYQAGQAIINDIEENMVGKTSGYYSYSGVHQFCEYLKEYLSKYYVENDQIVHGAQKASRSLLSSIQLMSLSREKLDEAALKQLLEYNKVIAVFGSHEQCELQLQTLGRQQVNNPGFYTRAIAHLESLIARRHSEAA